LKSIFLVCPEEIEKQHFQEPGVTSKPKAVLSPKNPPDWAGGDEGRRNKEGREG
jgi:hypothetical protein